MLLRWRLRWLRPRRKKGPPAPQVVAVADQEVATPIGGFKFTHLTLSPDNILPNWYKFNGVATNLADHSWALVFFKATFIGASGEAVSTEQLYYSNIGALQSVRLFRSDEGESVTFSDPPTQFKIEYLSGTLDVDYRLRMIKPVASDGLIFEDEDIQARFALTQKAIQFEVFNKGTAPVTIDWNRVSFIDITSSSHPVTHEGVKYVDARSSKPPSVIPPSAKLSDAVIPADNVQFTSGEYGGWSTADLLTRSPLATSLKGCNIGVFLPMEINGVQKNYVFSFEITDVLLK